MPSDPTSSDPDSKGTWVECHRLEQRQAYRENDEGIGDEKVAVNKIAFMAASDPKFIARLITALDQSMGAMMQLRTNKVKQLQNDNEDLAIVNKDIEQRVLPKVREYQTLIRAKEAARDKVREQLEKELASFTKLERDTAFIIRRANHQSRQVGRSLATVVLKATKGWETSTPTTELLKTSKSRRKPAVTGSDPAS